jgi:hypothetical protein
MTPTPPAEDALPAVAAAPDVPAPGAAPDPEAAPEPGPAAADAAAWAEVLAAWDDEARHRAYLARVGDLDGLAAAGRRYAAVLAERPGDPLAARFRDEVVRRAVAHGLASLPRSAPEHRGARLAVRVAAGVVLGGLLLLAGFLASRLVPYLAAGARP